MSKSTAVTPSTASASALAISLMDDVLQDAKTQPDVFTREDVSIPFLRILQDLSPEVKKRGENYVEGAEPGDLLHSITRKVWKSGTGLIAVPIVYQRHHIEWKPRETGGGFVADHGYAPELVAKCVRDDKGRDRMENGNHLVTTALYYLLILTVDEDKRVTGMQEAVLPLKSTQLKKARQWNAMAQAVRIEDPATGEYYTPKMFYSAFLLTTVPESNDQGSWYGLKIEPFSTMKDLVNGKEVYNTARHLAQLIERGEKKTDLSQMDGSVVVETEAEPF